MRRDRDFVMDAKAEKNNAGTRPASVHFGLAAAD
jgi:hypothetical protein